MLQKLLTFLVLILFISVGMVQSRDDRTERTHKVTALFSPMGVYTVYDLQSNGVPNEIWQDPLTPTNVHATFMYSTVAGFATRACAYMFSNDGGATWTFLGDVPASGRSGFPSISGYTNGAAVIANHNNTNGTTTRTKINYDAGPGFGVFAEIDPGDTPGGQAIWPRVVGIGSDKTAFASSIARSARAAACVLIRPPTPARHGTS